MNAVTRGLAAALAALIATTTASTAACAANGLAAEPARTVYIVGDSITLGVGIDRPMRRVERYAARTKQLLLEQQGRANLDVHVIGHGGQCLVAKGCIYPTPLVRTLGPEALQESPKPTHVLVEIGVNDLAHATSRELREAFRLIDARAERRGVRLLVGTIPPPGPGLPWPKEWTEAQRVQINDWIRVRWPHRHVDFDAALRGPDGGMRARYDSGDGLHPNAAGAAAMAAAAAAALSR